MAQYGREQDATSFTGCSVKPCSAPASDAFRDREIAMHHQKPVLSEQLLRSLHSINIEDAEQMFLQLYQKNTEVFLVKTNVAKQSVTELSRQISVMTSLASTRYEFTSDPALVFGDDSELNRAFSSMQNRGRIGDLFVEWITDPKSGQSWNQRAVKTMMHASQHNALNVNTWDSQIFAEQKLALACLLVSYFEFSLATLREFDVSRTAYKRSRPLRELHLAICHALQKACAALPLQELSALMKFPLDRAILAQQSPEHELLTPTP